MDKIHVRPYFSSDLSGMMEVRDGAIRRIAGCDYTQEQVDAWARQLDLNAQAERFAKTKTWVAEIDGVIVGYTNLRADGYLDCLYVHEKYQRCGVARALFHELEATARDQGILRLFSEVSITARLFFESRGFRVVTQQKVAVNGQEFVNFQMEKYLQ